MRHSGTLATRKTIEVRCSHAKAHEEGVLEVLYWSRKRAWQRAFLVFSGIYFVGLLSQLNPGFHFMFPPLWIIAGPFAASRIYLAYRGSIELRAGKGRCPSCKKTVRLFPYENHFPAAARCPVCKNAIDIQGADGNDCLSVLLDEFKREDNQRARASPGWLQASWAEFYDQFWTLATHLSFWAFGLAFYLIMAWFGEVIYLEKNIEAPASIMTKEFLSMSESAHLLAALVVILIAANGMGYLFKRMKQPMVMGEIAAGILLGPSVFGFLAPQTAASIFSPAVMAAIYPLAQIGIVFFLFLVGINLDTQALREKMQAAWAISSASIVTPFLCGAMLAFVFYSYFSGPGISFFSFSMFLGLAFAITAFPVLARIMKDLNIDETPVGQMALSCAAMDDLIAWILLALVSAFIAAKDGVVLPLGIALTAYFAAVFIFMRPLVHKISKYCDEKTENVPLAFGLVIGLVLLSALFAEWIGIHAVFGAFLVGVFVPKESALAQFFKDRLQFVVGALFLPLFFAYTGSRTNFALVNSWYGWAAVIAVVASASLSKIGSAYAAARLNGFTRIEAWNLGCLMNTRGLMELVVLNVGLDLGIITPQFFAIMVAMAFVTTLMTTPMLKGLDAT